MAVVQMAEKITTIITVATPEVVVAGMEIHKDMPKPQNADGRVVDLVLPEVVTMMTTEDTVAHQEVVIMMTTTEDMDVDDLKATVLHMVIMKTVADLIPATGVAATMMTTGAMAMVDGLETLKVIPKLPAKVGKAGEAIAAAAIITAVQTAVVTDAMIVMMITTATVRVVAGMVIQKDMRKQLIEAGKTVDIKLDPQRKSLNQATFFLLPLV
jgi:hypothetical protein